MAEMKLHVSPTFNVNATFQIPVEAIKRDLFYHE
jgi:hypothetical protein